MTKVYSSVYSLLNALSLPGTVLVATYIALKKGETPCLLVSCILMDTDNAFKQ